MYSVQRNLVYLSADNRKDIEHRHKPLWNMWQKTSRRVGGTGRILGQNLIEDNMRNLMRNPGTFDSLKPPPLLTGSLTQNFRVKNINKMTKAVDRPKQQAVEADRSQLPGNVSTQAHVVFSHPRIVKCSSTASGRVLRNSRRYRLRIDNRSSTAQLSRVKHHGVNRTVYL